MYVMKTHPGYEVVTDEGTWKEHRFWMPARTELLEMTPAELREATADPQPEWAKGANFREVAWQRAHAYVRDGGHHMTALYMGEDRWGRPRIKYARDTEGS